jgi:hypothetical protein
VKTGENGSEKSEVEERSGRETGEKQAEKV